MKIGSRKSALVICAIVLFGCAIVSPTFLWNDGSRTAEYRITLLNQSGDPIKGAELVVEDSNGNNAGRYPILEYTGDGAVRSNDDGVFVVHKIPPGLRFLGRYLNPFKAIPIAREDSPSFEIVFLIGLGYAEIGRVDFRSLDDGIDFSSAKRVRRKITVSQLHDDRMPETLSEKELSRVAIDEEFPIVERTITLNVVGNFWPQLEEDAEIQDSFAKLESLLSKINKDTELTLYEGVPRFGRNDEAEGKTHWRFGYLFYDIPHQLTPEKLNELRLILRNPNTFEKFGGFKACGGFHPDFSLHWKNGETEFEIHLCFGCHEMKAYADDTEIYCDIEGEAYKRLKKFFSDFEIHRPKRELSDPES